MTSKRRIFHPRPFPVLRLIVGFALVWAGLWFVTSLWLQRRFDAWLVAERAHGYEITFDDRQARGSPLAVTLKLRNFRWKKKGEASLHTGLAVVTLHPWNWKAYDIALARGVDMIFPLTRPNELLSLKTDHAAVRLSSPLLPPGTHGKTGFELTAAANNLTVRTDKPLPFGDTVQKAALAFRIMGTVPDWSSKDSVTTWNETGGVVECDTIALDWGPLHMAMKGTLGLNTKMQPEGAFAGTIGNRATVVQALTDKKWISKSEAGLLNATLNQLPATGKSGNPGDETIPLTLQGGGLFFGPVLILTLPPLSWN